MDDQRDDGEKVDLRNA